MTKPAHLHLVPPRPPAMEPPPSSRYLGFVSMSGAQASSFIQLLERLEPRWLLDCRFVSIFALGGNTSRRWFFADFARHDILYMDIAGRVPPTEERWVDPETRLDVLAILASEALATEGSRRGPVLFLLSTPRAAELAYHAIPSRLPGEWEPCLLPL